MKGKKKELDPFFLGGGGSAPPTQTFPRDDMRGDIGYVNIFWPTFVSFTLLLLFFLFFFFRDGFVFQIAFASAAIALQI